MGTRSLTFVYDELGKQPILNLYRQFDGYPSGHGVELAEFLDGMTIVNGIRFGDDRKIANGMSCLAAQLVAHFKSGVGGFYIHSVTDTDCWQDYEYHLYNNRVVVKDPDFVIFDGSWVQFDEFCQKELQD